MWRQRPRANSTTAETNRSCLSRLFHREIVFGECYRRGELQLTDGQAMPARGFIGGDLHRDGIYQRHATRGDILGPSAERNDFARGPLRPDRTDVCSHVLETFGQRAIQGCRFRLRPEDDGVEFLIDHLYGSMPELGYRHADGGNL